VHGTAQAFSLGFVLATLLLFAAALSVLVHYVARDTENFRQFLEGL
jgi:hypothetical protein